MTDARPHEAPLRIDIVSDVVCPWCIIGWRQLEMALEQTGVAAEIHWHPFELNPQMPEEGQNLREHLMQKYGSSGEESVANRQRLTELGRGLGFTFDYFDEMRMVNTFRAHQLLHWAGEQGVETDLQRALFSAFFSERKDVSDANVLVAAAESVGLEGAEARRVLEDGRFADKVRERQSFWTSRGIQGVPAIIFQQQYLASGAQGVENYVQILQQLTREEAA